MTQWPRSPRRACKNTVRVRRGVAEQIILRLVLDQLLKPAMVEEMIAEMRACYEHNRRIARLAKGREPDPAPDALMAIIRRAETKRTELLSSAPEMKPHGQSAKRTAGSCRAVPVTLTKGSHGNPTEAGRARVAVWKLLCDEIEQPPAEGRAPLQPGFASLWVELSVAEQGTCLEKDAFRYRQLYSFVSQHSPSAM